MKKSILMMFCGLGMAWNVMAQDSDKMEFLLDGRVSVSAFGGPIIEFSSLNNEMAISSGGGGALLLNKRFFVGGYGIRTRSDSNLTLGEFRLNHGGFWVGLINNPQKLVHWGVTSKFGWGTANQKKGGITNSDNIFVVSPEVMAEFNVTTWCKINTGLGYRLATGFGEGSGLRSGDFSSPTFTLNFLFGWFGR